MKKLCFLPLLFLAACSTTKTPTLALHPQPPQPTTDDAAVRYPEIIRAYHIGRYADPNDDLVMHEQHVVYRVEENTRWNLHPTAANGGAFLSIPALHDAAFSPTPVNDDILAEVNAQRLATVQIELEAQTLAAALARFQTALQQTKTNLVEMAVLRAQVSAIQKQLAALEAAKTAAPTISASTNEPPDSFDTDSMSPEPTISSKP